MKSILFDLDGTLTDPYLGISRCIVHALDALKVPRPSDEQLRGWIGPPLKTAFSNWFSAQAVDADPDRALSLYRERFSVCGLYENELYQGIRALVFDLKARGFNLYVATAKPWIYAVPIIEYFQLDSHISAVYGSELDGRYSDKSELLTKLLTSEQLSASDCTMVGDRHHDINAAASHAMNSVAVLWGYGSRTELESAGAGKLVDSVTQLGDMLCA